MRAPTSMPPWYRCDDYVDDWPYGEVIVPAYEVRSCCDEGEGLLGPDGEPLPVRSFPVGFVSAREASG